MELADSTKRLLQLLGGPGERFEFITAQKWLNLLSTAFPLNSNENFLYAPEFSRDRGRCDLVISQSDANFASPWNAMGVPFLAVEFKSSNASDTEWLTCMDQLRKTMLDIAKWKNRGQWIMGFAAAGTEFQFFYLENGEFKWDTHHDSAVLNLYDPAGQDCVSEDALRRLSMYLDFIEAHTPVKTM
ncbi:hypothetical protein SPI_00406 [Niveomyces insectorum RCEF 264]|uniref:Uncharacterized protein n=1 Tax=Niveomyces insectorum RCEF 264 TaxID=1081102 RepID=A0A168A3X2_9HYPO|nr:hypothetical protein SPI_00406 [Niveomyces insectorum RCEF 264]